MPFSFFARRREPIKIFVEGNIGAGKTSCALRAKEMLADKGFDVLTMTEDVDRWKRQKLLGDMYGSNMSRAAVRAFQALGCLRQYVERAQYIREKGRGFDFIICERHPSTTLEVFGADDCVREMYAAVESAYHFMLPADYTVYVKAEAEECAKRVKRRARRGESGVSVAYLRRLSVAHDEMMNDRVENGGVVYEIECTKITLEETAARMCEAALRIDGIVNRRRFQ